MRYQFICLIFIFTFLWQASSSFAAPVRFGPLPMHSEGYVRQEFYPFIKYLESVLQRPVQFVYRHSYKELTDGLVADEIDLAFLGPLPFALMSKQNPDIIPLLQFLNSDGSVGYTCSVGVFSADHLQIEDLKNKKFALTQPYSTCGFLMTERLLNQRNLSLADNEFQYVGRHPDCALAVIDGKFSACGIKTSIGKQFHHLGLDLIAESEPVPSFVLVANRRTLKATEIEIVRDHLLALKPLENKVDAEVTKDWGALIRHGASPTQVDDFRIIFELLHTVEIPGVAQ